MPQHPSGTPTSPDPEERRALLAAARAALETGSIAGEVRGVPDDARLPGAGVFVTLRSEGNLRGCVGILDPSRPLVDAVRSCALSAAHDPRFEPLKAGELPRTHIEISILGPLRRVAGPEDIVVGRDGLLISLGPRRGLLLPQVASERGWNSVRFLEETCRKAGLRPGAWREGAEIEAFAAEVFCEDDPGRDPA